MSRGKSEGSYQIRNPIRKGVGFWTEPRLAYIVGCLQAQHPFSALERDDEAGVWLLHCEATRAGVLPWKHGTGGPVRRAHAYMFFVSKDRAELMLRSDNTTNMMWLEVARRVQHMADTDILAALP